MLCGESHRGFKSHRYRQEEARNRAPNQVLVPGFSFPWGTIARGTGARHERLGRAPHASVPAREGSHPAENVLNLLEERRAPRSEMADSPPARGTFRPLPCRSPVNDSAGGLRRGSLPVERHGIGPAAAQSDDRVQVGKDNDCAHGTYLVGGECPPGDGGKECSGNRVNDPDRVLDDPGEHDPVEPQPDAEGERDEAGRRIEQRGEQLGG